MNPQIANEFSTAIFRFGHSMLSSEFSLVNRMGEVFDTVFLRDMFFNPGFFTGKPQRVDNLIGGFLLNQAQEIDTKIVDEVRDHLFKSPNGEGTCLDLGSLNIQRGRDHGLMLYNGMREAAGLENKTEWYEVTNNAELQAQLASVYDSPHEMDAWVGALAEDHLPGASVGELVATVIKDQFSRLMYGDPFFYLNDKDLKRQRIGDIWNGRKVSLEAIIRANTILDPRTKNGAFFVGYRNVYDSDSDSDSDSDDDEDDQADEDFNEAF